MKALFLCMDMHNGFHGSLMHVLEYAEYFHEKGYEIYIGSEFISADNYEIAEKMGFKTSLFKDIPLDQEYDLVYALHMVLFPALLAKGLKYRKSILMTLSAYPGIELLPPSCMWPYYDVITALSEEIVYLYLKRMGFPNSMFMLAPNHIPLAFMRHPGKNEWNSELKKVAVISNHFVPSLFAMSRVAPFKVDLIGQKYKNTVRVTPELLTQYDAVVSIGKTVQYGMGLGVPVFEYDMHGGCGYITPQNMAGEELTNFSGRSTRKEKAPEVLIQELLAGYAAACESAPKLREMARAKFDIDKIIQSQLALAEERTVKRPPLKRDALLYAEGCRAVMGYIHHAYELGVIDGYNACANRIGQ